MSKEHLLRWRLHSTTKAFQRCVEQSREIIRRAAAACDRWVISWSAGKDSTAMAHLVRTVIPDAPIMIQCDDCDWPQKRQYMDRISQALGWEPHVVEPGFSVRERFAAGRVGEEDFCSLSHPLTQEAFIKPLRKKQEELGAQGVFLGLRIEESRARAINIRYRGDLYQLKSGQWRCCPIGRWSATDVFAYLVANDIEINPCYLQNRFLEPEEVRLAWAMPTPLSMSMGELERLRYYYPEQYQWICELMYGGRA